MLVKQFGGEEGRSEFNVEQSMHGTVSISEMWARWVCPHSLCLC